MLILKTAIAIYAAIMDPSFSGPSFGSASSQPFDHPPNVTQSCHHMKILCDEVHGLLLYFDLLRVMFFIILQLGNREESFPVNCTYLFLLSFCTEKKKVIHKKFISLLQMFSE